MRTPGNQVTPQPSSARVPAWRLLATGFLSTLCLFLSLPPFGLIPFAPLAAVFATIAGLWAARPASRPLRAGLLFAMGALPLWLVQLLWLYRITPLGYPLLAISQAALDGLNARLADADRAPVTITHFRPNLVIDGTEAHAEDGWRRVRIGGIDFDAVKPCTRCVFTTVDPVLGQRRTDGEPLNILKDYRRTPAGITFGMNLIARGEGVLRVGDAVERID